MMAWLYIEDDDPFTSSLDKLYGHIHTYTSLPISQVKKPQKFDCAKLHTYISHPMSTLPYT